MEVKKNRKSSINNKEKVKTNEEEVEMKKNEVGKGRRKKTGQSDKEK